MHASHRMLQLGWGGVMHRDRSPDLFCVGAAHGGAGARRLSLYIDTDIDIDIDINIDIVWFTVKDTWQEAKH
eukprot:1779952-Prymnesium_polylepis.1